MTTNYVNCVNRDERTTQLEAAVRVLAASLATADALSVLNRGRFRGLLPTTCRGALAGTLAGFARRGDVPEACASMPTVVDHLRSPAARRAGVHGWLGLFASCLASGELAASPQLRRTVCAGLADAWLKAV